MTIEEKRDRLEILLKRRLIYFSGFGGLQKDGTIVDRREYPNVVPIVKYALLGVPEPNKLQI